MQIEKYKVQNKKDEQRIARAGTGPVILRLVLSHALSTAEGENEGLSKGA